MSNPIVVLVGVFTKSSTNIPQAIALSRAGFNVIPVSYRQIISERGHKFFNDYLIYIAKKFKPALMIFCKCNNVDPIIVAKCTSICKTFLWNPDPWQTIERCPEVVEHAKNATYSSSTSITVSKKFEENGVKKCHHIIEGLDVDILKPVEFCEKYEATISFIGTKTPERDMYLKTLKDAGYNVQFYGPEYSSATVDPDEFAKICSSSKCMLSLNTHNNIPHYFSDRIIRLLGCGSLTFHLDSTNTLNDYFRGDKEIIYFSDENDLLSKMEILNDKEACGKIATAGYDRVMRDYTWDNTIRKMLEVIND